MNKQNEEETYSGDGDADVDAGPLDGEQTKHGLTLQTIYETMKHPEFAAEQLPELWQQVADPGGTPLTRLRRDRWQHGIEAMYLRCETYPQHTKLAGVLNGLPPDAWHTTGWIMTQGRDLLQQATNGQLLHALAQEQQNPPEQQIASYHILMRAGVEQLTRQIVEQLTWRHSEPAAWAAMVENGPDDDRRRHIAETIQQQLLEDNDNAWPVFLGIIEPGHTIGDTAALAAAIEQQHHPSRQTTRP